MSRVVATRGHWRAGASYRHEDEDRSRFMVPRPKFGRRSPSWRVLRPRLRGRDSSWPSYAPPEEYRSDRGTSTACACRRLGRCTHCPIDLQPIKHRPDCASRVAAAPLFASMRDGSSPSRVSRWPRRSRRPSTTGGGSDFFASSSSPPRFSRASPPTTCRDHPWSAAGWPRRPPFREGARLRWVKPRPVGVACIAKPRSAAAVDRRRRLRNIVRASIHRLAAITRLRRRRRVVSAAVRRPAASVIVRSAAGSRRAVLLDRPALPVAPSPPRRPVTRRRLRAPRSRAPRPSMHAVDATNRASPRPRSDAPAGGCLRRRGGRRIRASPIAFVRGVGVEAHGAAAARRQQRASARRNAAASSRLWRT